MTVQRNLRARYGLQPSPSRASTSLLTVHLLDRAAVKEAPSTVNLQRFVSERVHASHSLGPTHGVLHLKAHQRIQMSNMRSGQTMSTCSVP